MIGGTPSWWYRAEPTLTARALMPVAHVYDHFTRRSLRAKPRFVASCPVICVGNFTAGGTGKTPFVRLLIATLKARGLHPVVLTRGHGGTLKGPLQVEAGRHTAAETGDEPQLYLADVPVVIAQNRAAGGHYIATHKLGDIIVMDDGLQNPGLKKDLAFAVVDGARGFGNGRVIPSGPLRADAVTQARVVDAYVLNHGAELPVDPASSLGVRAVATLPTRPTLRGYLAPSGAIAPDKFGPLFAFAGIGAPERFFRSLVVAGFDVRGVRCFPDHHRFSDRDARILLDLAQAQGLQLITTEKDQARLGGRAGADANDSRARLAAQAIAFPVVFTLDTVGQGHLDRLLDQLRQQSMINTA